jgi:hypothetical protein
MQFSNVEHSNAAEPSVPWGQELVGAGRPARIVFECPVSRVRLLKKPLRLCAGAQCGPATCRHPTRDVITPLPPQLAWR